LLFTSCHAKDVTQGNPVQEEVGINAKVSDCGGFEEHTKTLSQRQRSSQCRDEQLVWRYNQQTNVLLLSNQNVWLNCCGEHTVSLSFNRDTTEYEMRETDAPLSPGGRCYCMCFFDFNIELPNISAQALSVSVYRYVTDAGPEQMVWRGIIELQTGSGEVVIQPNRGYCQ
jgi:hypothetical protein